MSNTDPIKKTGVQKQPKSCDAMLQYSKVVEHVDNYTIIALDDFSEPHLY